MKKIYLILTIALTLLTNSCLDLEPTSVITDKNYWKTAEHYDAFMYGLHSRFRTHAWNFFILGEGRSDVYGDQPFGGEATQGMERYPFNTLNKENAGVGNYGGFYENINQINLFISKAKETNVLTDNARDYYFGQAYAMRAYYFFHIYRTWGAAVFTEDPSLEFEMGALDKEADTQEQIMEHIKSDIKLAEESFGTNCDFLLPGKKKSDRGILWSKPALLMLKAEVYLWTSHHNNSKPDATAAKLALEEIKTKATGIKLLDQYKEIFEIDRKGNQEMILAIHNDLGEHRLFNDQYRLNLLPGDSYLNKYFNEDGSSIDLAVENTFGLMRLQIKTSNLGLFGNDDLRKNATVKAVYDKDAQGAVELVGTYPKKYPGRLNGSSRVAVDDYPIYRYADMLLLLAEAKVLLGEDPAEEINLVRERAYKEKYDATVAFPNQVGDSDAKEAILKERFLEFMVEGKRWYDLRRFGNSYVFKYTTADSNNPKRLLWPIDKSTLTKNPLLNQTPGYE